VLSTLLTPIDSDFWSHITARQGVLRVGLLSRFGLVGVFVALDLFLFTF
jgi:NADH:ubiquinone oxidoreductase subunit 4 (subunit M)